MAEISSHINTIRKSPYGENVRDAIIDASEKLVTDGKNYDTLSGKHADDLAALTDVQTCYSKVSPFDQYPTAGSTKICTSGGLYEIIGNVRSM